MIDYKYSDVSGITPVDFLRNNLLQFYVNVKLDTGELDNFKNADRNKKGYRPLEERKAVYNHCNFIVTNGKYINFSGSVHEYFNNGDNSTDFTFYDLFSVTKDLHKKFKINPFLEPLHNVEHGVNILLPFDTQTLLNAILCFKGKEYELRRFSAGGSMIKFTVGQYQFKIYEKGKQRGLHPNLLRIEIKTTTMEFLRAKGITLYNSADLLNPAIHPKLCKLLVDFCKQLIIYDASINPEEAKPNERKILMEGQNPKYWTALNKSNRELYKKRLQRFRQLNLKYGKLNPQQKIIDLVQNKWEQLTYIEPEKLNEINYYLNQIRPENFPQNNRSNESVTKPEAKKNFPQNKTSNGELQRGNLTAGSRCCKTCGRDISNQKRGSIFCSETIYGKQAKKCRNRESNPRNNLKGREQRRYGGLNLFEVT